uniref:Pre-rRNA-processing protein Ipi1 N-terminal domain-containing protein n=1 Tax=Palpitomonas bilix TaxID=652834 RepID=A0A7S3D3X0_9EUKA|mmetsp:Transcript_21022/g.54290  ORF Transcript_21022/g.54290 Transcript_21022/m.54290 type:complete len:812 (+) Transcript_21022:132-2567(+)
MGKRKGGTEDFQKKKVKLGRTLPKRQNETETSFQSRKISLLSQSIADDKGETVTKRNLSLNELLSQTNHYNAAVRKGALEGMLELYEQHPKAMLQSIGRVCEIIFKLLTDGDGGVRSSLYRLLFAFFDEKKGNLVIHRLVPFGPRFMGHITAALSHVQEDIRLDGVVFLLLLLNDELRVFIKDQEVEVVALLMEMLKITGPKTAVTGLAGSLNLPSGVFGARILVLYATTAILQQAGDHLDRGRKQTETKWGSGSQGLQLDDRIISMFPKQALSGDVGMQRTLLSFLPALVNQLSEHWMEYCSDGQIERWSSLSILLLCRCFHVAALLLRRNRSSLPVSLSSLADSTITKIVARFPFRPSASLLNSGQKDVVMGSKTAGTIVSPAMMSVSMSQMRCSALLDGRNFVCLKNINNHDIVDKINVHCCSIVVTMAPLCDSYLSSQSDKKKAKADVVGNRVEDIFSFVVRMLASTRKHEKGGKKRDSQGMNNTFKAGEELLVLVKHVLDASEKDDKDESSILGRVLMRTPSFSNGLVTSSCDDCWDSWRSLMYDELLDWARSARDLSSRTEAARGCLELLKKQQPRGSPQKCELQEKWRSNCNLLLHVLLNDSNRRTLVQHDPLFYTEALRMLVHWNTRYGEGRLSENRAELSSIVGNIRKDLSGISLSPHILGQAVDVSAACATCSGDARRDTEVFVADYVASFDGCQMATIGAMRVWLDRLNEQDVMSSGSSFIAALFALLVDAYDSKDVHVVEATVSLFLAAKWAIGSDVLHVAAFQYWKKWKEHNKTMGFLCRFVFYCESTCKLPSNFTVH